MSIQSPGTYAYVIDESGSTVVPSTDVTGVVVVCPESGVNPLVPTLISGGSDALVETYGSATSAFPGYVATKILADATTLYVVNIPHTTTGSNTAASAIINNASEEQVLEVKSIVIGEDLNGYVLKFSNISAGTFTYTLYDASGTLLEKTSGVSLDPVSLSYAGRLSSDYLEFVVEDGMETETIVSTDATLAGGEVEVITFNQGDFTSAIEMLADKDAYNCSYIVAPCQSHVVSNITAMTSNLDETGSIQGIIVPPQDVVSSSDVTAWSNGTLVAEGEDYPTNSINNSQISVYAPWIKVFDDEVSGYVWISPEPEIIISRVYTNNNYQPWFAPAGPVRGKLSNAVSLATQYNQGDRDLMYGGTNIVNPICKMGTSGYLIYGQKTSLRTTTKQLTRVNVRTLQNYLYDRIMPASQDYVFEPNDSTTWSNWIRMVYGVMREVKNARGVYDFLVEMEPTDTEVDSYEMPGLIKYKPTKAAEFVEIYFNLVSKSADL